MTIKMTEQEIIRRLQKSSLRFIRRERALQALDLDNRELRARQNALVRERRKISNSYYRELLKRGIEPSKIPLYK